MLQGSSIDNGGIVREREAYGSNKTTEEVPRHL